MNYKPWYALSEFVDNSLASFLRHRDALATSGQTAVTVQIQFDRGDGAIDITDDAAGIAEADVARAFRAAEPPPDRTGLSQFGIGMKSAACWFAESFLVRSTALEEAVSREVEFDVPTIVSRQIETLPIATFPAEASAHGTFVHLSRLHRPIPSGQTLRKIRRYLASIYRHFLREGLLVLEVGEEPVEFTEPDFLQAPRWNDKSGPRFEWRKELAFELPSGVITTGWAGLRARGSTSEAGLALLHRGKVVVGAGSAAGQPEDLFRPGEIFGAPNSFVSQRLVGELDVSDFRVAHSKDAILWDGDYDALLDGLRAAIDEEPLPLLKMAQGYRALEKGADVSKRLKKALDSTATAAAQPTPEPTDDFDESPETEPEPVEQETRTFQVQLPDAETEVHFSVVVREGRTWIRVVEGESRTTIEVDRAHRFMQSYAHLPNQDIEPLLRIAAALGLAEIRARRAGARDASTVRAHLNDVLRGALSETSLEDPTGPAV